MDFSNPLPDYGPLEIKDYKEFLEESKNHFEKAGGKKITKGLDDFEILKFIGSGAYGDVFLLRNKHTQAFYAAKAIKISKLSKEQSISRLKKEKYVSERIRHPFLVKMELFAHDRGYIYFIAPYYSGGDLFQNLYKRGKFQEFQSMFYSAQVVLGLEYLHYLDIIYRDLKPENVVLDHTGYVKIIDFGFSKIQKLRTYSICGTEGYIAPEVYANKGYGKSVDWWSLGIFIFEISSGKLPAFVKDPLIFFKNEARLKYKMPSYFSKELAHLIRNLLQTDLTKRFGNLKNGVDDIKDHAWFRPILWMSLLNRKLTPPLIPLVKSFSALKTSNDITNILNTGNSHYSDYSEI